MYRRSFLVATLGLAVSNVLAGCSTQPSSALRVRLLNGSVPTQILNKFRIYLKQSPSAGDFKNAALDFAPEPQLQTLFSLLQTWKQQANKTDSPPVSGVPGWIPFVGDRRKGLPDLVTLGDYWLGKAIQQQLIQPIDPNQFSTWNKLPRDEIWRQLVTRNNRGDADLSGRVWAAPHRWGTTVIVYRRDIFERYDLQPPTDWRDLWRKDLRGHISVPDQPREVIGLILKKLGQSYNAPDLEAIASLDAELETLRPQIKLYSSDAYLQPLLLGDTWLAVGWSTDVLPVLQRNPAIAAVVPASGTALWAELWVRPAAAPSVMPTIAKEWLSFTWQPQTALELSQLSRAASAAILTQPAANIPEELRNSIALPAETIRQRSEFLLPLPEATVAQYRELWKRLRQLG